MAVRHVLEFSVCLLGVCVSLCVAACLTQSAIRRYNRNGLDLQNVTVIFLSYHVTIITTSETTAASFMLT